MDINEDKEQYAWKVCLQIKGHIDSWMFDYYEGLDIKYKDEGNTLIEGNLSDISALYGMILYLRDTGLELLFFKAEKVVV
ncbi:hypothetical protein SYNTR_0186 [Candidatus Syntrophocurvum alkaliphilum]|uniref:Uncharacterized protein n=1 Tax=Candidatus Syntrophocurvum alkaliphilum TaxID=2293317 RepID=A0A6I6DGK0_9FIRM|nr:hypothetical protein [Candidatus Syntrophocurvum alkaliphilum]QGT98779.1 hypothetical protein SYNTR_0186 [Candidatus Syntrophocurvum alkaliphilum]